MEPPASVIAASEPPDQAPFLPASRFSLHASSAVPVLKGTSTSYFDIITMFLIMVSGFSSLQKISVLEPFPFSILMSLYRLIL